MAFHAVAQVNRPPIHRIVSRDPVDPRILLRTTISRSPPFGRVVGGRDPQIRHGPEQAACRAVQPAREPADYRITGVRACKAPGAPHGQFAPACPAVSGCGCGHVARVGVIPDGVFPACRAARLSGYVSFRFRILRVMWRRPCGPFARPLFFNRTAFCCRSAFFRALCGDRAAGRRRARTPAVRVPVPEHPDLGL